MRSLFVILLLLATNTSFAELLKRFSFTGGFTAIGSDIGYLLGMNSPYARDMDDFSLFLNFAQYQKTNYNAYTMLTAGMINRFVIHEDWAFYGRLGFFATMNRPLNLGLAPALGTEYRLPKEESIALFTEMGVSWPLGAPDYGQGAQVNLGCKFYL